MVQWTLGPRQSIRYQHTAHLWRPNEADHALNARFGGIVWSVYGTNVPMGFDPTPSHISPSADLMGPQVETDMIFTLDTFVFPQEVLLIAGDVMKMAGYRGEGVELRLGRYWMVRGNEQPHVIHAHHTAYLMKIFMEFAPGEDFPGIPGS